MKCSKFKDGCLWKGSVGTLSAHMQSCEFDLVPCKYKYIGCEIKMKKKDMEKHQEQEDGRHLRLALQSVVVPTLSESQNYAFELTDYTKRKESNEVFISDPFYAHHKGFKMCVKVYANGTGSGTGSHLSASLCVLQGPYDKNVKWPLEGRIKLYVLNQSENNSHMMSYVNLETSHNLVSGKSYCFEEVISHILLSSDRYLKKDTLYFKVVLCIPSNPHWLKCGITMNDTVEKLCKQLAFREPVTFKVKDFAHKKKNYVDYYYYSKTSCYGYSMKIEVHAGGANSGKDTHISVFVFVIRGPNDQNLTWPFIGTVKLELLNQLADKNHHNKVLTFTEKNNTQADHGLLLYEFISHSELNHSADRQFLMNDTIYFRVTVSVGNSKPWLKCSDD